MSDRSGSLTARWRAGAFRRLGARLVPAPRALVSRPAVVYAAVALVVLGPALGPGYLLTVDMVFAPDMHYPTQAYGVNPSTWASLPYLLILEWSSAILPGWIVQKIVLFLVLWLAGLGAHRLIGAPLVGAYFAGLLYMLNPYVGLRLVLGQWTLLAAFAVIPFAVTALLELFRSRSPRAAVKVALLWTLAGIFQLHGFILVGMIFVVMTVGEFARTSRSTQFFTGLFRPVAVGGTAFLLLNAYWLVPLAGTGIDRIEAIPPVAMDLFRPRSSLGLPIALEVAGMGGFHWTDLLPNDLVRFWQVLYLGVVFLALTGLLAGVSTRWSRMEVATVGVIGFILALGASSPVTKPIFEYLWTNVPGFRGFRDSHKFVALLVLAYAYFGALGVSAVTKSVPLAAIHALTSLGGVGGTLRHFIRLSPLLLPAAYGFGIIGFVGQVRPTEFPPEWYEAKATIKADNLMGNLLVFPWHSFMDFHWLEQGQRRVSNPSRLFFDVPTIQADNLERPGYYSDSSDPVSAYVESLLDRRQTISHLGNLLTLVNVRFVLLLKDDDYTSYSFLNRQQDLQLVASNSELVLFKNMAHISPVLGIHSNDLDARIEDLLSWESLSGFVFTGAEPIEATEASPIEVTFATTEYDVVALPLHQGIDRQHWELDGQQATVSFLGFIPTFRFSGGEGVVRYAPFLERIVWGYLASAGALLISLQMLFWRGKR